MRGIGTSSSSTSKQTSLLAQIGLGLLVGLSTAKIYQIYQRRRKLIYHLPGPPVDDPLLIAGHEDELQQVKTWQQAAG